MRSILAMIGASAVVAVSLTACSSSSSEPTATGSASEQASPAAAATSQSPEAKPSGACALAPDTKVTELTYGQLQQYELNNGEAIPTLAEFLDYANEAGVGVLPEIKTFAPGEGQPRPEPTAAQFAMYQQMVEERTNIPEVLIGTFDEFTLKYFAQNKPEWTRIWFRGIGNGDAFAPPSVAEMKERAPSANALGLLNVLYYQGTFPVSQQTYDTPKEFADAKIPVYIWYNVATGGDGVDSGAGIAGVASPGWQAISELQPQNVTWIATDFTKEYTAWADAAPDAAKPVPKMVAHRGGGQANVSENSMAAFKEAVANGASVLETDVQWTKPTPENPNGVPVLMHDATINRTSACAG